MKKTTARRFEKFAWVFGLALILMGAGVFLVLKKPPAPGAPTEMPKYQTAYRLLNSPGAYGLPYADLCYPQGDFQDLSKDICYHCGDKNGRLLVAAYHSDTLDTPLCIDIKTFAITPALPGRVEFKR